MKFLKKTTGLPVVAYSSVSCSILTDVKFVVDMFSYAFIGDFVCMRICTNIYTEQICIVCTDFYNFSFLC